MDQGTHRILNFQSSLTPTSNWPNGASETVWDYGTTRSTNISNGTCREYLVDYQIPLGLLDASAVGGPTVTADTPIAFLFATANSLQNPLQKDAVLQGDYISDPNRRAPFGDTVTLSGGTIQQPIVDSISAAGCGPTTLTAQVKDGVNNDGTTTVTGVYFYYYYDSNGDSLANDGNTWTLAITATNTSLNEWTASWDSTGLSQGQYLIGVQAIDDAILNADGKANRTFSYLTQDQVGTLTPPEGENYYANPSHDPGVVYGTLINTCGASPSVSKAVDPDQVTASATVTFTIAISNPTSSAISATTITDTLPSGFSYGSTVGGTLTPTLDISPTSGVTGNITWTFSPSATVSAGGGGTLLFTATASTVVGTYANVASAETTAGTLTGDPVQIGVGAPRLTIAKEASSTSANPGDTITYTIRYANDSPVNVTGAVISDVLPTGLTFVSASDGGSYEGGTRTITWNVGDIPSGDGPFTVRLVATVDDPYPDVADIPLVNTATVDANETDPASASASTYINVPRPALSMQKDADKTLVAPGGQVTFTISYANTGNYTTTNVIITDAIPTGFTYVSASTPVVTSTEMVTWSIGPVAAGANGSVTLTLQANDPYTAASLATNVATIDSAETLAASDSFRVGVSTDLMCSSYYFHDETANVGADGIQEIANRTAPLASDIGAGVVVTTPYGGVYTEALRFYQDPATSGDVDFAGSITATIYIDRSPGNSATISGTICDYDSTSGITVSLGSNERSFGGSQTGVYEFSVPAAGTLQKGHRLLWIFALKSDHVAKEDPLLFQYDGTVTNTLTSGTTFADSHADFCVTSPANLVLDKQASKLCAQPGDTLTYTIKFANPGQSNAIGVVLTDTLPTGTAFVTATLNGSPATPTSSSPPQYSFNVNSSDVMTSGLVTGGGSGELVITATVDQPLAEGITSLLNTATVESNQTLSISDTVTTEVSRPDTSISKSASDTLLTPGDTVTFTLTVLNSGDGTATNVTVSDTLPATAYFSYVLSSTQLNGTTVTPDPVSGGLLSLTINSLAAGASSDITFQMQVATSGVPDGVTELGNIAIVSDTQTSGVRSSDRITVSISSNANLELAKGLEPSGTLSPGDLITFTLTMSNVGASDAKGVLVRDPILDNTSYVSGTLVYSATAQTDVEDGDVGRFDSINNRVLFDVGTLAAGASREMQLTVRIGTPLPAGTTFFTNTATASAENAAAKTASASTQATAAPNLIVDKTGPSTSAYPAATLTAAATNTTTLQVGDSSQLEIGQYVRLNSQTVQITDISRNTITVTQAVTASAGADLLGSFTYGISYRNDGDATATNLVITDTLPTSTSFITATVPHVQSGNVVTWTAGSLAPSGSGVEQVTAIPTSTGSLTDTAAVDSGETTPLTDTVTTEVGSLRLSKRTATPVVTQTLDGTSATYMIQIENTLASAANGVLVTDSLVAGFVYSSTVATSGFISDTPQITPTVGTDQPAWGTFSITGSGTLVITFTAKISPTVGAAIYQNAVAATSSDTSVTPFDPLLTTDEDVHVLVPAVSLAKMVWPDTVAPGGIVTYTITAANSGDATASAVTISDTLPSAFTYVSTVSIVEGSDVTRTSTVSPTTGSAAPAWGVWDIAPSGALTVTFIAGTGMVGGIFSNTVSATAENTTIPTATSTAPVTVSAPALQLAKSSTHANGGDLHPGDRLTYTLVVSNSGSTNASEVVVSDTIPVHTTYVPSSIAGGNAHYDSGLPVLTWTVNLLLPNTPVSLTFAVTVNIPLTDGTPIHNAALVTCTEGVISTADVTDTVVSSHTLEVSKNADPSPVQAGSLLTYTLHYTIAGDEPTYGVRVSDTTPAHTTFYTATPATSHPSVGSTGPVIWHGGELLPESGITQDTGMLTMVVRVDSPLVSVTVLHNAVSITDTSSLTDSDEVDTPVTSTHTISLSKSAAPSPVQAGDLLTYTIAYTVTGNEPAFDVTISDTLPLGTTYQDCHGGLSCGPTGGVVTWYLSSVNPPASGVVTLVVQVDASLPAGAVLTNAVTITDTSRLSDTDEITTPVEGLADLTVSKADQPDPVAAGTTLTYTLVYTNNGACRAQDVYVTDTLSASVHFGGVVSEVPPLFGPTQTGQLLTWYTPTLPAGTQGTIVFTVTVNTNATGTLTNSVIITSVTLDPDASNNADDEPTEIPGASLGDYVWEDLNGRHAGPR